MRTANIGADNSKGNQYYKVYQKHQVQNMLYHIPSLYSSILLGILDQNKQMMSNSYTNANRTSGS